MAELYSGDATGSTPYRDANGNALAGATLQFFRTGTDEERTVYSDQALTTPLTQPITADSSGVFVDIWLDKTYDYRVRLERADGRLVYDVDPYPIPTDAASTEVIVAIAPGVTTDGIIYSTDGGDTWESVDAPAANAWRDCAYSPTLGRFVAIAETPSASQIMYSDDGGQTWNTTQIDGLGNWHRVIWSPTFETFVAGRFANGFLHLATDLVALAFGFGLMGSLIGHD